MKPFRVNWWLSQPVCLSEYRLHLDALLAYAIVDEAIRDGASSKDALACQATLPLERVGGEEKWIWKASSLLFKFASPPFLVQCVRQTDVDKIAFAKGKLIDTKRSQISQGTGYYKDFDLRFAVQWVKSITAYGVGDIKSVTRLLSTIPALGKLTRNGWGRIMKYSVEEDPEAVKRWQLRTLPQWIIMENSKNHCPGVSTVRPPYWRREFQEPVWEFIG
jgi:CRISPR type IV-associated protein Csf3